MVEKGPGFRKVWPKIDIVHSSLSTLLVEYTIEINFRIPTILTVLIFSKFSTLKWKFFIWKPPGINMFIYRKF